MELRFLFDAVFRANPLCTVTEWNRLNQPEQQALAGLLTDANEIFGVFKPVDNGTRLRPHLAYKEVALLFYFLQQPGALPYYIRQAYDDDLNTMLARLVMEDVLQVEWNGTFVSGASASKILYKEGVAHHPLKHIEALSKRAIEYVLQLHHPDLASAMSRLYCYNTIPSFGNIAFNKVPQPQPLTFDTQLEKQVAQYWTKHLPTEKFKWLSFHRKNDKAQRGKKNVTYKIYISPLPSCFADVYHKTAAMLHHTKAFSFKTAMDQRGILRPDRLVLYFHTYSDLEAGASALQKALQNYPAQGVPFTAQLDDAGLLSWGIDPPQNEVVEGIEGGSWRALVTEKLGLALLQAKEAALEKQEAYDFIIRKIFLENINPVTWVPHKTA